MYSSPRIKTPKGFTLLEIMIAVTIIAFVSVGIYRFVESTLTAVTVSTEMLKENVLVSSFAGFLRQQLQHLPEDVSGALTGEPHRFNNIACDELHWIASPGSGLLTRHAEGAWNVTLTTKPVKDGLYDIGLNRQDVDGRKPVAWLKLFGGVSGFEVRYYDPQAQEWQEKWENATARPVLVRMRLWRNKSSDAYEVVIPLPLATSHAHATNFNAQQQQQPQLAQPQQPQQRGGGGNRVPTPNFQPPLAPPGSAKLPPPGAGSDY